MILSSSCRNSDGHNLPGIKIEKIDVQSLDFKWIWVFTGLQRAFEVNLSFSRVCRVMNEKGEEIELQSSVECKVRAISEIIHIT